MQCTNSVVRAWADRSKFPALIDHCTYASYSTCIVLIARYRTWHRIIRVCLHLKTLTAGDKLTVKLMISSYPFQRSNTLPIPYPQSSWQSLIERANDARAIKPSRSTSRLILHATLPSPPGHNSVRCRSDGGRPVDRLDGSPCDVATVATTTTTRRSL